MTSHSTNYFNTLIEVAEDCPVVEAEIPKAKGGKPTVASLQYELLQEQPYTFSSDDLLFAVHAERKNISEAEQLEARGSFFARPQACMRASPLPKRYGWGVHSNAEGKLALIAVESAEYDRLSKDKTLSHVKAMRSKRN